MRLKTDAFNNTKAAKIYIAKPNRQRLGVLAGVTQGRLNTKFNDIWTLDLEVDKYIYDPRSHEMTENPFYKEIDAMMEFEAENIGWFRLNKAPTENILGDRIYKAFSVDSLECQLIDTDLTTFVINYGILESREMFEENLDILGIPIETIRLYYPEKPKLSLLDIIVDEYLNGWKVGHVDKTIDVAEKEVRTRKSFQIDSKNVYAFLTQDASAAYGCVFEFDTYEKSINAYDIRTYGKNTSITLSYRNIVNSIYKEDTNNTLTTRFRVEGGDDASIIYYNFGSDMIENLSYLMNTGKFKPETAEKYQAFLKRRDAKRDDFAELTRQYNYYLNRITVLEDRVASGITEMNWNAFTLEELREKLEYYKEVVKKLEEIYTDENGILDIQYSSDYSEYLSYKLVTIPNIEAEIKRKESGSSAAADYVDPTTIWELYGLNELRAILANFENWIEMYKPSSQDDKQYTIILEYIKQIKKLITQYEEQLEILTANRDDYGQQRREIIDYVAIDNKIHGFTPDEILTIKSVYAAKDFKDQSIILTSADDSISAIEIAKELYESACKELEIASQPQFSYSIEIDNLLQLTKYESLNKDFELGNFIWLLRDDQEQVKLRITELEFDIINTNSTDFSVTFSNMITSYGQRNDFNILLNNANSANKNSIQKAISSGPKGTADASLSLMKPYLHSSYLSAENADIGYANVDSLTVGAQSFTTMAGQYFNSKEIVAEKGKIADFEIKENAIKGEKIGIQSTDDYAFWAGSDTAADAPFRVKHNGDAVFEGKLQQKEGLEIWRPGYQYIKDGQIIKVQNEYIKLIDIQEYNSQKQFAITRPIVLNDELMSDNPEGFFFKDANSNDYANCTAKGFNNRSSVELKTDIKPFEAFNHKDILDTEVYTYYYKNDKDKRDKKYGFVIGDGYHTNEKLIVNGNSIDLYNTIALLWRSQQMLIEEVTDLKKKLGETMYNADD